MDKLKRHYFYDIQMLSNSWHPIKMSSFILITLLVNAIFLAFPIYFWVVLDESFSIYTEMLGKLAVVMLGFHALCTLVFHSAKRSMQYQILQVYIFPIILYIFGISPLLLYWLICDREYVSEIFYLIGILIFIVGICIIVFGFFSTISQIKKGEYQRHKPRKEKENKRRFIIVDDTHVLITFLVLVVLVVPILSFITDASPQVFAFIIVSLAIYIPMCAMIPEFLLLAYCKKRFPSFHPKE